MQYPCKLESNVHLNKIVLFTFRHMRKSQYKMFVTEMFISHFVRVCARLTLFYRSGRFPRCSARLPKHRWFWHRLFIDMSDHRRMFIIIYLEHAIWLERG